ncbi:hypothetical protein [Bacillus sp. FJAT-50079]|uniref:hypothetical protein n=1 Tax=Bacillus sp. FJAT-50079 TaxID=2833577 RepID=UPI001BC91062|nr:hypothetical protein [Bacillus sp. FJAT-50079]MBS4210320.1 hypothetical protein [Bacillus sp. FJAT-50079]
MILMKSVRVCNALIGVVAGDSSKLLRNSFGRGRFKEAYSMSCGMGVQLETSQERFKGTKPKVATLCGNGFMINILGSKHPRGKHPARTEINTNIGIVKRRSAFF